MVWGYLLCHFRLYRPMRRGPCSSPWFSLQAHTVLMGSFFVQDSRSVNFPPSHHQDFLGTSHTTGTRSVLQDPVLSSVWLHTLVNLVWSVPFASKASATCGKMSSFPLWYFCFDMQRRAPGVLKLSWWSSGGIFHSLVNSRGTTRGSPWAVDKSWVRDLPASLSQMCVTYRVHAQCSHLFI